MQRWHRSHLCLPLLHHRSKRRSGQQINILDPYEQSWCSSMPDAQVWNSRTQLIPLSHRALLIILILDHISCLGLKAIWCVAEVAKTCVPGPSCPSMTGPLAESARSICKDASRHVKSWQCWKEGPSVFVKIWVCFRTHQWRKILGGIILHEIMQDRLQGLSTRPRSCS